MCRERDDAMLRSELRSTDPIVVACALCYVLSKEFGCTIKGGAIRDIVVLNKFPNDIDTALPKILRGSETEITDYATGKAALARVDTRLKALGVTVEKATDGRKFRQQPNLMFRGYIHCRGCDKKLELEYVPPYNRIIWPQTTVDATMNNLQLSPADVDATRVLQIVAIGISTERIVRQIVCDETSPVQDVRWIPWVPTMSRDKANPDVEILPEGVHKNVYCEAVEEYMEYRLQKIRSKHFRLVEGPSFAGARVTRVTGGYTYLHCQRADGRGDYGAG
jgi:hypothetical protein